MMIAALLLLWLEPPEPPPQPDRWAAAVALWEKVPPSAAEKDYAMSAALEGLARQTLAYGRVKFVGTGWIAKLDALMIKFRARLPQDRDGLDRETIQCAAKGLAYSLEVVELHQVGAFLETGAGAKFWALGPARQQALSGCYQAALRNLVDTDGDLRAVGIKPPKRPYPPVPFQD